MANVVNELDSAGQNPSSQVHRVAYSMRALGKSELPRSFLLESRSYRLIRTIKHDFFAATGLYRDDSGHQVVLKISRMEDFAGVPLQWLGRMLRNRELHFYRKLTDVPSVPKVHGTVGKTGFVMEFVQGGPLSDSRTVPDRFFDELFALVRTIHGRGMAYVDTNKPQNILLGADGKPHMIDFQISWDLHLLGDWWLNRWLLRRLQADDIYHLMKHKKRLRRDELTDAEREQLARKSIFIRSHRFLTKPYFLLRRRLFQRLRDTGRLLPEGSK